MNQPQILNIYSQEYRCQSVYIVGNRRSLLELREAIDAALQQGGGIVETRTSDNDAYTLQVILNNAPWDTMDWLGLKSPYTDPAVADQRPDAIRPYDIQPIIQWTPR